jgi:hypothetical protein
MGCWTEKQKKFEMEQHHFEIVEKQGWKEHDFEIVERLEKNLQLVQSFVERLEKNLQLVQSFVEQLEMIVPLLLMRLLL